MRSCEILMRRRIKSIANCGIPTAMFANIAWAENTEGDKDYWPYYRKSDFEYDLARPMYLFGAGT
jgi:hypothetical protein